MLIYKVYEFLRLKQNALNIEINVIINKQIKN